MAKNSEQNIFFERPTELGQPAELPVLDESVVQTFLETYRDRPAELFAKIKTSDNPRTASLLGWMCAHAEKAGQLLHYDLDDHRADVLNAIEPYIQRHSQFRAFFCLETLKQRYQPKPVDELVDPATKLAEVKQRAERTYSTSDDYRDILLDESLYDDDELDYDLHDNVWSVIWESLAEISPDLLTEQQADQLVDALVDHLIAVHLRRDVGVLQLLNRLHPARAAERLAAHAAHLEQATPADDFAAASARYNHYKIMRVLAMLDPGIVPIQDKQANYLGVDVKLLELDATAVAARRVSVRGDVFLFDSTGNVNGHFNLSELEPHHVASQWKKFTAAVKKLGLEDIFLRDIAAAVDMNEQQAILDKFVTQYQKYSEKMFAAVGKPLHLLSLREQAAMFKLLDDPDQTKVQQLRQLADHYNIAGLRAGVSADFYHNSLSAIVKLDQTAPPPDVAQLLNVFYDYIENLEVVAASLGLGKE